MINLLPPDLKTGYRFARRNVSLRKWVIVFLMALVGLGAITTYGSLTISQSSIHYRKQIDAAQDNFQKEKFAETQKRVKDISNSFKLVVKVLSQEILFSQLLKQIAAAIPENAKLTGLNIIQTKGAIDITAVATNYTSATQVQVNLADPDNKIFTKADIVSINCGSTNALDPLYPCTVNIRALFGDSNPFLFINSKTAKTP